jgi:hypothetical protein
MADKVDRAKIEEEIKAQGNVVRQLKSEKAPKEKVCSILFLIIPFLSCFREDVGVKQAWG